MVSASISGGGDGPALRDRNLIHAYDDLAWYRYLAAGMGREDPTDAWLTSLDWDRSAAQDAADVLKKAKRDADGASEELARLKLDVSNAWSSTLQTQVQASVGALAQDYETFADELAKMRKHLENNVFDGLHAATEGVKFVTGRLKTKYGYMLDHPVPSPHDHEEVQRGHTRWQIAHHAVEDATGTVRHAVGEARDGIRELTGDVKSDKDPVHMTYAPPPKSVYRQGG